MKKQFIIIIILLITIGGVLGWIQYRTRQKQVGEQAPAPTPQPVQALPPLRGFPQVPPGTTFVYGGPEKLIPESLTTYQAGPALTNFELTELAARASKQLGLTASPSAAIVGGNFVYVVNQGALSFSLLQNEEGTTLSYRLRLAQNTAVSPLAPGLIARDFINQLNIAPASYTLSGLGEQKIVAEDITVGDVPAPNLYEFGFGLSVNNIPLLSSGYAPQWATAVVDERGAVRLAKASLPPAVLTPTTPASLVSLQSAINALNTGRGALVFISETDGSHFDVTPAFVNGIISDFELVYVRIGSAVVPAYRFIGSGQTREGKGQAFEAIVLASSRQP